LISIKYSKNFYTTRK